MNEGCGSFLCLLNVVGSQELEVKSEDSSFLQLPNAPAEQTTPTAPKRSRTFDDIREENRHRHRQKVYAPAEGRPTAADDGDTWRQGESIDNGITGLATLRILHTDVALYA